MYVRGYCPNAVVSPVPDTVGTCVGNDKMKKKKKEIIYLTAVAEAGTGRTEERPKGARGVGVANEA